MVAEPTTSTPRRSEGRTARPSGRRRRHLIAATLALGVVAGAAACGSDPGTTTAPSVTASSGSPSTTSGTTPGTTPTGTSPKGTTPGTTAGTTPKGTVPETSLPTADGGGINSEIEAALDVGEIAWSLTPAAYRDQPGVRFAFVCPPGGTAATVWGNTRYTDDSSVCTAAVHDGFITFEAGGRVVIEMREGDARYQGSVRNGVTSLDYGEWPGTFIFPGRAAGA